MRWEPITIENVVDKLTGASEHAISDFKLTYDTKNDQTKAFEIAKDVCAFANHLGGTIIVGAQEGKGDQRGRIAALVPLTDPSPGELVTAIDRAVKLYCLPVPLVNAQEITLDDTQATRILRRASPATSIVAINVQPALNTPIGCLTCCDQCTECKASGVTCSCKGKQIDHAYRFPIRTIESARYLRPDELAKTMNVTERRALLELQAIEGELTITVWFNRGGDSKTAPRLCQIEKLDPELLICVLGDRATGGGGSHDVKSVEIPLTFVRATWRTSAGWNVSIDGMAFEYVVNKREGYSPPGGFRV
jgi:hypothetical protein